MTCFWGHKWTKWSEIQKIQFVQRGETHPTRGTTIFAEPIITQTDRQERKCERCGKAEYNILRD